MNSKSARTALTLVELLVVMAIIAVLIGLLLPAVLKVRDASYRVQCASRLKQIGVAAQHHHAIHGEFPSGIYTPRRSPKVDTEYMTWLTKLLPFLEQDALWRQTVDAYRQDRLPFHAPPHVGLSTVVPTFTCPADGRTLTAQMSERSHVVAALTSFLGASGTKMYSSDGVLFRDSKVRLADIADGTSNTLLAGERPPSADFEFGWCYAGKGINGTGTGDSVLGVREVFSGFVYSKFRPVSCSLGPYHFGPGQLDDLCDIYRFWSLHSGGANFAFCDGSVRFLAYSADPILPALATRSGGDAVTLPD